jgi:hypothetical protein
VTGLAATLMEPAYQFNPALLRAHDGHRHRAMT